MSYIRVKDDLPEMIRQFGILPFFANSVPGWSVEEHIDPAVWFTDQEGPWEWKGQLASERTCIYGKFVRGKSAFISPDWFPDFANYRRNGYDWEGWVDDGTRADRNQRAVPAAVLQADRTKGHQRIIQSRQNRKQRRFPSLTGRRRCFVYFGYGILYWNMLQ